MANDGICLDAMETFTANKDSSLARIVNCAETPRQLWSYDFKTQRIIQRASNNCLTAVPNVENTFDTASEQSIAEQPPNDMHAKTEESKFNVSAVPCTVESKLQKWMLLPFEWK